MSRPTVDVADLPAVLAGCLELDDRGWPVSPLVVVRLDDAVDVDVIAAAARAVSEAHSVVVGVSDAPPHSGMDALGAALTTTVVARAAETAVWQAGVDDMDAALDRIARTIERAPVATRTLTGLLEVTAAAGIRQGLIAESLAYSMLLSGPEFATWLSGRERRAVAEAVEPAVLLARTGPQGDDLRVTLNRPERHNAFDRAMRDGLVEAFDLASLDKTIRSVTLAGRGPSFCSGGDLDEFGTSEDRPLAHLVRIDRSVAARMDRVRDRVTVHLHGATVGAGIELASFAGRVAATADTRIVLPELAMGLIPGAGGTVGIPRRIGRWRTAFLALTGCALPLDAAVRWGLVDAVSGPNESDVAR